MKQQEEGLLGPGIDLRTDEDFANAKAAEHVMAVVGYADMEEPDDFHRELIEKLLHSPQPRWDDPNLPYINAVTAYLAGGDRVLERMYEDGF